MRDAPDELNKIVERVLAYKPKSKSKAAMKRKRQTIQKETKPA